MSKICITCNSELKLNARTEKCLKCRRKETCKKWTEKNKESFLEYQREYRENNRELCNQRTRTSYKKKPEEYNKKTRLSYRKTHNLPLDPTPIKNKNGEGNIDSMGYKTICIKDHPNAMDDRGRIREHIFVMSEHLGRPLRKGENVHHMNGIRHDNRIENLELWNTAHPPGQRVDDKIKWYIEFLNAYGYKVVKE